MEESSNKAIPFERHPLYEEAMQQIVAGDKEGAVATLKRLAEYYPDEQFLQDLLVRVQLQSTFGGGDYIPVDHSQGTPVLRTLVLVMLAITTCLVVATGLIAVYNNWWLRIAEADDLEESIISLWDDFDWRFEAGDLSGARETLEQLAALTSDDAAIQEALEEIKWRELCSDMYADAVSLNERGEWQAAMDLLYQISPECYNYDQAQWFNAELKELGSVETAWLEAQKFLDAQDWQSAITTLTWIRQQDSNFRRVQVENYLFESHKRLAYQLLDGARGDVESVRQAATHLQEALQLKPTSQDLRDERKLAVGYVAGHEAYDRGDWSIAVVRWEPLYVMRPDYQNGVLRQKLDESYPRAARQLIAEANGSIMRLTQAIDYLDQALVRDPGNEELLQERTFAVDYLAGLEAYVQGDLDLAIAQWGPIYTVRPDYQNGVLAEKLREACIQSTAPDEQYCKP
jgi:tetratricopeptide (TPR) repeat protein